MICNETALLTRRIILTYRKVMHSPQDGGRNNEIVVPNPNPKDKEPMYIGRRKRVDKMTTFEDLPLPWKYPKK